jgi:hypothetical protein
MRSFDKVLTCVGATLVFFGVFPGAGDAADAQRAPLPDQANPGRAAQQTVRPQCIHRQTDDRPSIHADDKLLTVWLAVGQKTIVDFRGWGTAGGNRTGALKITLMLDGVAVGRSVDTERSTGANIIRARADTQITLLPGSQHKLTARPEAPNKSLLGFEMQISIKGGCT